MLKLLCLAYCIIFAGLPVFRNLMRWMHGFARAFGTARNSDLHALIVVLPKFLASGARGECRVKQSAGTAKYCGELSFLRDTRTEFCWIWNFHINCYKFTIFLLCIPVANSPIHRVYRRYTKYRRTQNIDELCFFAKESITILNVYPTNQLRK